ncbi:S8 family peptidase [Ramlibacter sp.]|uniref:S8 family peptidase n=1 Tax=Ramlibacter sp. TaxID=1917967 RepID=UPI0035B0E31E
MPHRPPAPLAAALRGAAALLLAVLAGCGGDREATPAAPTVTARGMTDQIIVQPADDALVRAYQSRSAEFARALAAEAGLPLAAVRQTHAGAHVLALPAPMRLQEVTALTDRLARRTDVAYAEPDTLLQATLIPGDPAFVQQWHLRESSVAAGGINAVDAWDLTTGDPNLVIAVVDSGVLRHAEFGNRLMAGYDFIANTFNANDGNARDTDAADPGDWLTYAEAAELDRTARASSWHGTHVAGTIGATGNNGSGVVGVNWRSRIQPIRVLGKGGGYSSDIADGIVWAAGGTVSGVPANPTPARVINLSLGGEGNCSQTTRNAIQFALGQRAVVVVAAGNDGINASMAQPANCPGVIAVAAVGARGQRSSYSNWGSVVTIAAPGGDPGQDSGVLSLGDSGSQRPANDSSLLAAYGTSMAAPHVAGVVSLILSVNPALGPDEVKVLLQSTARAFPTGTGRDCTTATCGAGIVNAGSAVRAAANATAAPVAAAPQSGVWWNPAESGRGYVIEFRDGKLQFGAYLYDADGRATWVVSGPAAMQAATRYSGPLEAFSGGQTLGGAYQAPSGRSTLGNVTIDFTSATTATFTWPGGTVPIQRFRFAPAGSGVASFAPEGGVWWNPAESGRGFAIEVQDGWAFVAGFMYDGSGQPTWHLAAGPMSSATTFSAPLTQYTGGQTLTGAYRAPTISQPNIGRVSLRFIDTATAELTLPGGRTIPLEKFRIGASAPGVVMPLNQVLTAKLVGIWQMDYTIVSTWQDFFLFNEVRESEIYPGIYNVWGINQYDALALGSWSPELNQHVILASGDTFDDFYTFDLTTPSTLNGCYYLAYRNPTSLSPCYALTGLKLEEIAPLSARSLGLAPALPAATRAATREQEHAQAQASPAQARKAAVLALKPEVDATRRALEALRATRPPQR